MRKLTATLCLTIAVLLGSTEVSWSGEDINWKYKGNTISPDCFPFEWWSGDNFEAIAEHYSIKYSDDFSENTGKYFGKELVNFEGIPEPWDGGKYKLYAIRDLDTCPDRKEMLKYDDGFVIFTDNNSPLNFRHFYEIKYRKGQDISLKLCKELAPNFDGDCIQASIFLIGDWSGGSRGIAWRTYIYGLFETKNHKKYIAPLKSWFSRSEKKALKYYNRWKTAQ